VWTANRAVEKVPLATLAVRLKRAGQGMTDQHWKASVRLFRPATREGPVGIRPLAAEIGPTSREGNRGDRRLMLNWRAGSCRCERPILGLGYEKLASELGKLGFQVSKTMVSTVLERHGIPPAPERGWQGSSWRVFLNHYKDQFLACDFFTVRDLDAANAVCPFLSGA